MAKITVGEDLATAPEIASVDAGGTSVAPKGSRGGKLLSFDRHRFINNLYRAHWRELCGWLRRRYGPGPPDPEDVAQTAFRKISEIDDLTVIGDARAFLFTVAARTAISGFRWRTRTRDHIDREMQEYGIEVEEITPERVYMAKERLETVMQGLTELTAMQRELVMRSRVLGQTYAEISAETGWSLAGISRNLHAALVAVGRRLAQADGNGVDL